MIKQLFFFLFLFFSSIAFGDEIRPFEEKLVSHVHFKTAQTNEIGRIVIDDRKNGINEATWIYVNAALAAYKQSKPACIILELNTPGGEVFAAQRISDALKELDTQYGIPVIAYINNWAISAGAMLAYSCRFIVIAKDASMGAAEPITIGASGEMQQVSEKITSALRTDFANRAQFFGRNPAIAEAMVDKDLILVQRGAAIIKLDSEEEVQKGQDLVIKPKGKLLTLSAEQLMNYHVADALLFPKKLDLLTDDESNSGTYPLKKSPLSEIAYFTQHEPIVIETFQMNWQTKFFSFLATPAVSSLLFLGMLVGFYIEISSPGVVLPGIVGMLCLFFIVLSSFALEAVHFLEPILLVFGLFLIAMEIFFFPTVGILLVLGALFMLAGLAGMMLPGLGSVHIEGDTLNIAGEYVLTRLGYLSASFLVACVIILILSRFVRPHVHFLQKLVLGDTTLLATGTHEMKPHSSLPQITLKVGDSAKVSVTLRPAGKITVQDREVDAVSTGSFIEKGKEVKVVRIEGEKIIVEEVYT